MMYFNLVTITFVMFCTMLILWSNNKVEKNIKIMNKNINNYFNRVSYEISEDD